MPTRTPLNAVSCSAFFTLLNRHVKLGFESPVIEQDYKRLSRAELTVWNEQHPAPKKAGDEFERTLTRWLAEGGSVPGANATLSRENSFQPRIDANERE